jgi:hypothetical protein
VITQSNEGLARNVIDELGEAGAKPKYLRASGAKMRDVAIAAGVSVATVSNVINHPHMVAARTRERVRCILRELDFQPNPHAKALRGLGVSVSEPRRETVPGSAPTSQDEFLETPDHMLVTDALAPERSGLAAVHPAGVLEPGTHLSVRVGPGIPERHCRCRDAGQILFLDLDGRRHGTAHDRRQGCCRCRNRDQ